jgi:hypothetical protein
MGALQRAGAARMVAIRLDAEQLLLDPGGVEGGAVERTKGPSARRERACSIRAATSLPTPAGPLISTRELVGAILSMAARSCVMAGEEPISSVSLPARSLRSLISRLSFAASSARATISSSRSLLKASR